MILENKVGISSGRVERDNDVPRDRAGRKPRDARYFSSVPFILGSIAYAVDARAAGGAIERSGSDKGLIACDCVRRTISTEIFEIFEGASASTSCR